MPLNQEGVPYWSSIHFRLGPSPSCFIWTNGAIQRCLPPASFGLMVQSKDVCLLLSSLLSEDRPSFHTRGSTSSETNSLSGFTVVEKVMVIFTFLFKKVLNCKVALYLCSIEWQNYYLHGLHFLNLNLSLSREKSRNCLGDYSFSRSSLLPCT